MKRKIIGEGSYGCVHRPSIYCKTIPSPGFNYKTYVSKLMKTKNAKKELAEFLIIGKIDPTNKYHLGQPILCKPDISEPSVKNDIDNCKYINSNNIKINEDKYSLLVLKYGGPDLKIFCLNYIKKYLKTHKTERTDKFWLEVHNLIKGIKFFKDNGIIHNDIKPQNILFNTTNGKMKYIDFGLTRTKKEIINSSLNNQNYLSIFHWSYPFDCAFMDIAEYNKYKQFNNKTQIKKSLSELIVNNSATQTPTNSFNLPISKPSSFKILFTYINPDNTIPNSSTQYAYINSFFDGFDKMINDNDYDFVVNHIADSIDVFGLGFSLQFMANCFKQLNALSLEDYTRLSSFFHKMYDFNPLTRVINIDTLLSEYENILLEIGILMRLNKSFKNNNIVNKAPAPHSIMSVSKIDEKSRPKHLSAELQNFADKDPISKEQKITKKNKKCKRNRRTNKCVKTFVGGYLGKTKRKTLKHKLGYRTHN
jgi:serine/threonine protein kinase